VEWTLLHSGIEVQDVVTSHPEDMPGTGLVDSPDKIFSYIGAVLLHMRLNEVIK
jgi:hypothetical protein